MKRKNNKKILTFVLVFVLGISMLGMLNVITPSPQTNQNTNQAKVPAPATVVDKNSTTTQK